jgi:hypothetical protein
LEKLYEDSTLGRWMQKGGGGPGGDIVVLNPDSDQLAAGAAVDGANVAVLEKNGTAMMQTLDNVYQLGSEYEFTVALGDLVGTGEGGPGGPGGGGAPAAPAYTINLYAGDELIQSVTGTVTELDTLKDGITLTVEADRAALEGQPLSFEIVKTGGDALVVDNVRGVERRTNNVGEIVTTSLAIMDGSFEAPRLDDGEDDKLEDVYEDALPWMVDGGGPGGKDVKAIAYNGQTAVYLEKDDSAITQLLGEGYDANKTYEITLDLGDLAAGFGGGPGEGGAGVGGAAFRVSLLAGDEVIGTTSGNTGDRNGLEPVSFESVVIDPALEGAQLSLRIEKLGGEALVVDNIRGRVLQESASSAASDSASWTFEYEDASGALATKTVKATGANWTPDRLVDQVNATSGKTGWYAQRAEVNTTRAFIFMESATEDRTLTLETGQGSVEIEVSAGMTKAEFIDLVNAEGASIGIQAVEEKAVKPSDSLQELRFLSREDQVTVGFSLGASTLLFVPEGNTLEDNYSETFTKFVSFYRQDDLNLRVSQDSTVGDTTGFGEMQTLKLRDLSTNGGGPIETAPATTAEEALGALDDGRADFTIAAMARFADSLRSAQDYYGSLKDILKPAVDTANKVERAAEKAEGSERRELAATTFSQISRRIESTFEREKTRSESAQGNVNGQFVLKLLKQAGLSLGVSAEYLTNLQNALAA